MKSSWFCSIGLYVLVFLTPWIVGNSCSWVSPSFIFARAGANKRSRLISEFRESSNMNESFVLTNGLPNLGSTCYANSVIQMLLSSNKCRSRLRDSTNSSTSTRYLQEIEQQLYNSSNNYVSASKRLAKNLFRLLLAMNFDILTQEDAQEVYLASMNSFNESISSLFHGSIRQTVSNQQLNFTSNRVEGFYDLSLDIGENSSTLDLAVQHLFSTELLCGNNQYRIPHAGLCDVNKSLSVVEWPELLVFSLKRFSFDRETFSMTKKNSWFSFPLAIESSLMRAKDDIAPLATCRSSCDECEKTSFMPTIELSSSPEYRLQSIVVHVGNLEEGHYMCLRRLDKEEDETKSLWQVLDDDSARWPVLTWSVVQRLSYGQPLLPEDYLEHIRGKGMTKENVLSASSSTNMNSNNPNLATLPSFVSGKMLSSISAYLLLYERKP